MTLNRLKDVHWVRHRPSVTGYMTVDIWGEDGGGLGSLKIHTCGHLGLVTNTGKSYGYKTGRTACVLRH